MRKLWFMLVLAILPLATLAAERCTTPSLVRNAGVDEIRDFFSAKRRRVVTFLGYSGAEYEDPKAMLQHAARVLERLKPAGTIINIGATADGIGAIYAEAKRRGFQTSGIVSTQAQQHDAALAPCIDYVFYVADETWGGYLPGGKTLSPTSQAMVAVSDELVAIGGGDVARDEMLEAQRLGKKVTFIAADMNHGLAREKAARKGQPEPRDFSGSAHDAMKQQK